MSLLKEKIVTRVFFKKPSKVLTIYLPVDSITGCSVDGGQAILSSVMFCKQLFDLRSFCPRLNRRTLMESLRGSVCFFKKLLRVLSIDEENLARYNISLSCSPLGRSSQLLTGDCRKPHRGQL